MDLATSQNSLIGSDSYNLSISALLEDLKDLKHTDLGPELFWKKIPDYEQATKDEFLSFQFQTKHSLSNSSPLAEKKLLDFISRRTNDEFCSDVKMGLFKAPMAVQMTPYILSLINWESPQDCPIRTQFLPLGSRLSKNHPMVRLDSLEEKADSTAPGLVHRYFDRALFLPQTTCPVYCRFCTRSYAIGTDTETVNKFKIEGTPKAWHQAFDYLRNTPHVEDVVMSGGDSYNLHPRFIELIAQNLLSIDHIRRIRIATKGLAVNPGKIISDKSWTDAVLQFALSARKKGKQVFIHTHINSPEEITWITRDAMRVFSDEGVVVRNQSVLLRGVNDSVYRMGMLVKMLGHINIQPYYVYQHDLVQGVEDLRTSLATCLAIEKGTRGVTAGFNTPQFIVDTPGGGGKRIASTFDFYDAKTGISIFSAPSVKPGRKLFYFDPLHALDATVAKRWFSPKWQQKMCDDALKASV